MTSAGNRTEKRWYDDACGTAFALELVGERWSLLIVRELMFGPRRFGELRGGLRGISANVLTQRLEGLEAAAILQRRKLPPPASVQVYELTPWGYASETAIKELGRWAALSPDHDPSLPISAASVMLSFRTMFAADRAVGFRAHVGFRFGSETFLADVTPEDIVIRRAPIDDAVVSFLTEPVVLTSIVYGGRPIADAEAGGELTIIGDRTVADAFITLFYLPPPMFSREQEPVA